MATLCNTIPRASEVSHIIINDIYSGLPLVQIPVDQIIKSIMLSVGLRNW